ncbi:hypothetical protein KA047_01250 [Candidatus Saccharibacteria bacterium]|nr:hypothetical protein [Candidatus Saccharibacteria bacterium]
MSEATVLHQTNEQALDQAFDDVNVSEKTTHLTEESAAAVLAAEALRPDYIEPHERRELISPQDKRAIEVFLSPLYGAPDQVDHQDYAAAHEQLKASDNPYTQVVLLHLDIGRLQYMSNDERQLEAVRSNRLLNVPLSELQLIGPVARSLESLKQTSEEFLDLVANPEPGDLVWDNGEKKKTLLQSTARLMCNLADQLPTEVVSNLHIVDDALRTADDDQLPELLASLDRCIRQDKEATIHTARILGQAERGGSSLGVDRHLTQFREGKTTVKIPRERMIEQWHDYETTRTGITANEQQLIASSYTASEDEFERIHAHKNILNENMAAIPLKVLLQQVVDNPGVLPVIEQFNPQDLNDISNVISAIYKAVRTEELKIAVSSSSVEWTPESPEETASREQRTVNEFARHVTTLLPSLLEISRGEDADNVIKNVSELMKRPGIDLWGVTPAHVNEILVQYPALARHKDMPQIVDEMNRTLHQEISVHISDIYPLGEYTQADRDARIADVRRKMFENINRIAQVKPELLLIMTKSPFEREPRYKGVGLVADVGLKIESVDAGTRLTPLALDALLQRAGVLNEAQIIYWYRSLQTESKSERRTAYLHDQAGTSPHHDDDQLSAYESPLDEETFAKLIDLAQSVQLNASDLFDILKSKNNEQTQQVVSLLSADGRRERFASLPRDVQDVILYGLAMHGSEYMDDYMKALDNVASEYADYASIEMIETYAAILSGDLERVQEYGGIRIKEAGQKGIDQLTSELRKLQDRVLSGEVDIDEIESSAMKLGYFKQLVRYTKSQWGKHDDGSLIMLFKEIEYARSEKRTDLIDTEAYRPSQELKIAKLDQEALDAFKITDDGKAQWHELVTDIQFATDIVAHERPQKIEDLLGDISEKVQQHIERLEGGRMMLEYRLEELTPEERIQLRSESEMVTAEIARLEEGDVQNDDVTLQLDKLKLDQRVLKARLAEVPENKQAKLLASIEAVNVQIAELRDTTQEELTQTSKVVRHLRVLSQYDDMKSPLRRALFTVTLMKYPNEIQRVTDLLGKKPDDVKLNDLDSMVEFVQHMTNQETWGPIAKAFELQKGFNRVLDIGAINENISRGKNLGNLGKRTMKFIPTREALMEFSGHIGDACWANTYHSIARQFPNFTSVIMVQNPETKHARLAGSAFLIEAMDAKNEPVLIIRGLNPIQNVIEQLDEQDFLNSFSDYAREIAKKRGMKLAVVIDDHSGGSATNRPRLFTHMSKVLKPQLQPIELASEPVTEFNGYDISDHTYLL